MSANRPHPARTSLAILAATVVGLALTTTALAAALPKLWLSVPAALAIAVITAATYTVVREGPRAMLELLRR